MLPVWAIFFLSSGQMQMLFWSFPSDGLSLSLCLMNYYYCSYLQLFLVVTFPQCSPEEKLYITAIMALVIREVNSIFTTKQFFSLVVDRLETNNMQKKRCNHFFLLNVERTKYSSYIVRNRIIHHSIFVLFYLLMHQSVHVEKGVV